MSSLSHYFHSWRRTRRCEADTARTRFTSGVESMTLIGIQSDTLAPLMQRYASPISGRGAGKIFLRCFQGGDDFTLA